MSIVFNAAGGASIEPGGGGAGLLTSFSDALTTSPLSADWAQFAFPRPTSADPVGATVATIGATTFDGANGLKWSVDSNGSVNTWWRAVALPVKSGLQQGLYGKSQFAQFTILKSNGNYNQGAGLALCVPMHLGTGFTGYLLTWVGTGSANWLIRRANADSYTTITSGTDVINASDVLRFSVDQSVPGQATLIFKQNGTQRASVVDASPLITGGPGIVVVVGDTGAGVFETRTFSCGQGL